MLFHISTDVAAELRRIFRARRAARATHEVDTQKDESMSSEGLAQALSKGRLAYFMWGLPWLLIPTQIWLSCAAPARLPLAAQLLRGGASALPRGAVHRMQSSYSFKKANSS
jgi:hypothetical protein